MRIPLLFMLLRSVFLLPVFIGVGCSFFHSKSEKQGVLEALILVKSAGQQVFLGKNASGQESWARFDYDFKMGEQEVTVGNFKDVMGFVPLDEPSSMISDAPITFVSMYDAVRYCNALSKKEGQDTVYQYSSLDTALNGQTMEMEGLFADFSKDGFRLPTEVEWLFASRAGNTFEFPWGEDSTSSVVDKYAWTATNSNGYIHAVGTRHETGLGFYDLAGNALEMVWGRMGGFPLDTLLDYIGPSDASVEPQIVVKGGSYLHSPSFIKNSSRKDVYAVFPNSRLAYLGFRVAKGVISEPSYSDVNGSKISGSPFRIVATRREMQSFFRTSRVRLAFVNATNGALATVDFAPIGFPARELELGVNVANPVFSPDGLNLAFGTRYEGQSGKSDGYLMSISGDLPMRLFSNESAYRPRWWVDPSTENWWIVVGDSGVANSDTERWEKGTTRAVALRGASDRILTTKGAYHSGISTDARYLVTGYTRLIRLDLQNGESKELFLSPDNGKDTSGSTQACNVSVRPGPDPNIVFLDFGYPRKSTITGSSYGIHEYLFSADIQSGEVDKYFQVPKGYSAWGYSLWSNHPNYMIAAVADGSDAHKALYAVRYSDGAMLKLVEGDDVIMPSLWIDSLASEQNMGEWEDFGRYDTPQSFHTWIWNAKMVPYWSTYGTRDAYIFGTSREWDAIDPTRIPGYNFLNMAGPGISAAAGMEWARYYLWNKPQLPRMLILGIGPEFSSNFTLPWFKGSMGLTLGFSADIENSFWVDSLPTQVQQVFVENGKRGFNFAGFEPESLGFHSTGVCGAWGEPSLVLDDTWELGYQGWKDGWLYLKEFIKEATSMGIKVATIIEPMNPRYQETPYYTRHGGLRSEVLVFLDSVKSLEIGNSKFRHFDFHHDGKHDFKDNEAADTDHLCPAGAIRLTDSLVDAIQQWDSE